MLTLEGLAERSVLILGLAREGISTYRFLRGRFPGKPLGLADRLSWDGLDPATRAALDSDGRVELHLGERHLESLDRYDVIFKSPGISPLVPAVAEAERRGKLFCSNAELFFQQAPGPIVGVTGTKGKSTTTSAIHRVLEAGGLDARLTGNIGIAPLTTLEGATPATVFVAELSSHQLMPLSVSPHVAVVQNVVPEHLDYYGGFEGYLRAKENIVRHQGPEDYVVYNALYPIPTAMAELSPGTRIPFGSVPPGQTGCLVEEGYLVYRSATGTERVIAVEEVPLKGTFNLQNVMPAIAVGRLFGVAPEVIAEALRGFSPLAHRLEFVAEVGGIAYYNDSLATIPEAAAAALESFSGRSIVLIAGGVDRGIEFQVLARALLAARVRGLLLFPTTGERIWEALEREAGSAYGLPDHAHVASMVEAVREAHRRALPGDVVLLSPASASFGLFRDYRDRGDQFKAEVLKLETEARAGRDESEFQEKRL